MPNSDFDADFKKLSGFKYGIYVWVHASDGQDQVFVSDGSFGAFEEAPDYIAAGMKQSREAYRKHLAAHPEKVG